MTPNLLARFRPTQAPTACSHLATQRRSMLTKICLMAFVLKQVDCFGPIPYPPAPETFDYIIVGSGPGGAGALLGLIEHDPSAKVLLLERGKNLLTSSPSGGVLAAAPGATADFVAAEGATTFTDSDNVIIVESNVLGGLAAMNAAMWHHMPADYVAANPPNGDAHFDPAAWARAAEKTSKACTTYADDDASSHGAAVTSETSVIGEAELGNLDSANAEYAALDVADALPFASAEALRTTRYPFSDVCSRHNKFFKATLTTSTQAVAGNNLGLVPPVARVMHSHGIIRDAARSRLRAARAPQHNGHQDLVVPRHANDAGSYEAQRGLPGHDLAGKYY